MKRIALPKIVDGGILGESVRGQVAQLISQAEVAKMRVGAGASGETLAASLSAFFADAKTAVDAIVAQA